MELLPYESYYQFLQNLDIRDIIHLCQTNIKLSKICQDPYTWTYLLKRDFNLDYKGPDPYQTYIKGWILKNIDLTDSTINLVLQAMNQQPDQQKWISILTDLFKKNGGLRSRIANAPFPPKFRVHVNLSNALDEYDRSLSLFNQVKNVVNNNI